MKELLSYVLSGKVRRRILKALLEIEKTPTILAKEIQTHQSTTSRALADLEKRGLVKCLTPKAKLSRLYSITEAGKKVIQKVNQIIKQ
ncbi:winged helix-turn-helix transcriptional regulator [Candidatus Woesearchaeota archaeon]|jgi:DNA-binding MarR family transcriptional regulator|nr:winged helix-turn-helix transcriptional regulator [Candidatus Woesearchaeota archaeon]MBT4805694.1 winged helix-turn-helix transcriptional regulator [Candidatus Woesearchaeota archaeon]MBT5739929.1 winged helix-turn-helix transcriptional regulator [Candidatus Woesearchaeota archaeon]MBT6774011.1 winged helix-turn-helix transcriptional regulator [Candidatus Woesearchaeota archaeon]